MDGGFASNEDFVMEKDEPEAKRFVHTPTGASVVVSIGPWDQQNADVRIDSLIMISAYYQEDMTQQKSQVIQVPWAKGNMDFVLQGSTDDTGLIALMAARTIPEIGQATFINVHAKDLASAEEALNATAENVNYGFARP